MPIMCKKSPNRDLMHHFCIITKMVVSILLMSITCSCTRTVYQDREVVRHDSIYVTALSVDTILQRDSIHVLERGDTVYKTIQKYVYKVKERRDTCYVQRTDTVLQTETKEVQKTVRKNDWLELVGGATVAFLIGFFFAPLVRKKE